MKPATQSTALPPRTSFNDAAKIWAAKKPLHIVIISDPGDEQPGTHITQVKINQQP